MFSATDGMNIVCYCKDFAVHVKVIVIVTAADIRVQLFSETLINKAGIHILLQHTAIPQ